MRDFPHDCGTVDTFMEMQRKKKAYKAHFNPDWVKEWPALIAKSHKGDTDAFCRLCRCDFIVSSGDSKTCSVTSLIVTICGTLIGL